MNDKLLYDRIVREKECRLLTGLSITTRRKLKIAGKFPKRIKTSSRVAGWKLYAINKWMSDRISQV